MIGFPKRFFAYLVQPETHAITDSSNQQNNKSTTVFTEPLKGDGDGQKYEMGGKNIYRYVI